VVVSDDRCAPVAYVSGDVGADGVLGLDETWVYTCTTVVDTDTTNTAWVTGTDSAGGTVTGTATARVDVVAPAIDLEKTADATIVPVSQTVLYTILVSNTGDVPLDVGPVADNRCGPVLGPDPAGDVNTNGLLDPGEIWTYECSAVIVTDTVNTALVSAQPTDDAGTPLPGIAPVGDQDSLLVLVASAMVAVNKRLVSVDLDLQYPNYVVFAIEITNIGLVPVDVLPLVDDWDPYYLAFVEATPVPDVVNGVTGSATWFDLTSAAPYGTGQNLGSGETVVVTVTFIVANDINTTVNWAGVAGALDANGDPVPSAEDSVPIAGVPTAVELLYFHARSAGESVSLEWETLSETDLWAFQIYKGLTADWSEATLLHTELSQGGDGVGHAYTYVDDDVIPHRMHYYWLVYRYEGGGDTLFVWSDPQAVVPGGYRIYLPFVCR
jgi:hypothetical protein